MDRFGQDVSQGLRRHSRLLSGLVAAVASVVLTTAVVSGLKGSTTVESLGVVYVPAVLLVASVWGGIPGYVTALLAAGAFNWFHLPPEGGFEIAQGEDWVALGVLLVVALAAGTLAERARSRARDADDRRAEADLANELARALLRGRGRLDEGLPEVAERLAAAFDLPWARIELGGVADEDSDVVFPLQEEGRRIGSLILPASAPPERRERIGGFVVPSLEALVAAAQERDALLEDVVETAALRRSDVLKTALLRAVSHDFRTPLTAILTAEEALRSAHLSAEEHDELVDDVGAAARRLSRLVDKVLDLSRLEAEGVEPRPQACSLPEVVESAVDHVALSDGAFRVTIDDGLPEIVADAAQLERAFANLLENAARFSSPHPVSVRARRVGDRVLTRIVDRGPGVSATEAERIFEPFYRGDSQPAGTRGSGLGLAIARGFIDANGGRVWAESTPGQGTAFVIEFPA